MVVAAVAAAAAVVVAVVVAVAAPTAVRYGIVARARQTNGPAQRQPPCYVLAARQTAHSKRQTAWPVVY